VSKHQKGGRERRAGISTLCTRACQSRGYDSRDGGKDSDGRIGRLGGTGNYWGREREVDLREVEVTEKEVQMEKNKSGGPLLSRIYKKGDTERKQKLDCIEGTWNTPGGG